MRPAAVIASVPRALASAAAWISLGQASLVAIALALACVAAAWLSGGTPTDVLRGTAALCAAFLVAWAARLLPGSPAADSLAAGLDRARLNGASLVAGRPAEADRGRLLSMVAGLLADYAVLAGLAAGTAAPNWHRPWELATTVAALISLRTMLRACRGRPAPSWLWPPGADRLAVVAVSAPVWGTQTALYALAAWEIVGCAYALVPRRRAAAPGLPAGDGETADGFAEPGDLSDDDEPAGHPSRRGRRIARVYPVTDEPAVSVGLSLLGPPEPPAPSAPSAPPEGTATLPPAAPEAPPKEPEAPPKEPEAVASSQPGPAGPWPAPSAAMPAGTAPGGVGDGLGETSQAGPDSAGSGHPGTGNGGGRRPAGGRSPASLARCRDDGLVARWLGRPVRGNLAALPPAIAGLTATIIVARLGLVGLPGPLVLTPVVAMLLAAAGTSYRHAHRADWLVPAVLQAGQFVFIGAVGFGRGVPAPVTFALCAMIGLYYATLTGTTLSASPRAGAAPARPHWTQAGGLGWDGRMIFIGLGAMVGAAMFAYLILTAYLGVLISSKILTICHPEGVAGDRHDPRGGSRATASPRYR